MTTAQQIERLQPPEKTREYVATKLKKLNTTEKLLTFLARYASWNGSFAGGVAILVGRVSRMEDFFRDPSEPNPFFASRSQHLASFFHRALEEEFGDHGVQSHPDHAQLSMSFLRGVLEFLDHLHHDLQLKEKAPRLFADPDWMRALKHDVRTQLGWGKPDNLLSVFKSMGFMLAAEGEAAIEFTMIDDHLRHHHESHHETLVHYLQHFQFKAVQSEFPAYAWISIHSNFNTPGVESEHFKSALQGVNYALKLIDPKLQEKMHDAVLDGYKEYVENREIFFSRATE